MDVRLSAEQMLLRDSARQFLAEHCPMSYVRAMMEDARGYTDPFWAQVVALGWTGLIVPEDQGGAGLSLLDLVVLLEEQGRALMPGPYFSTVALGANAIASGGRAEQLRQLLPKIADGSLRVSLAQLETGATWAIEDVRLTLRTTGGQTRLSGTKLFVPDAHVADLLLVAARDDDGAIRLALVETRDRGVAVQPIEYTDGTRKLCAVRFEQVPLASDSFLGSHDCQAHLLEQVHDRAKVALCAEMLGAAEVVLELSVAYAKTREQFGSPIGRFQAIQHRCANMLVLLESARSATYYAAWAIDAARPDAHASACMAKAYCSEAFSRIAGDGIQIHGGMGFTWESDLHLYFKRAKASEAAFGSPAFNRELAARALIDP
jgi:alkylation response protein AidB-like acyl-CoA dehydrogenase